MDKLFLFARRIHELGGRAFLVGGCVRDAILGRPAKDVDIAVAGICVDRFVEAFPQARKTGVFFPVFRIELGGQEVEIAFARRERKIGQGHTGFAWEAGPEVTIEEDLARRDFTINAVAKDLLTGEVLDPFNGIEDIRRGVLRAVSRAFAEDPLRVYRAARFAATLGFDVAAETLAMMRELKDELHTLSTERVFEELRKALSSSAPSRFFRTLAEAGVLAVHFPELDALRGVEQPPEHHPEGDAFEHTMQVLDASAELTRDEAVRFAALVHDLGKGVTPRELWPKHHGHDQAGVPLVAQMATRLRLPKTWSIAGETAAALHMKVHRLQEMRPGKVLNLILDAKKAHPLGVGGLAVVAEADHRGRGELGNTDYPQARQLLRFADAVAKVKGDPSLPADQCAAKKRADQLKVLTALR